MPLRFVFALHNHQPIGNFDGVFEVAYKDSYWPFLELLEQYPEIPISLHTSGCLMEWLVEHKPDYIDKLRRLVARGQIEIMGGGFYEPILPMIPPCDRVGQIRNYTTYLERLLQTKVRGMWVPERVWEQELVRDITAAGIEYTVLDDYHFKQAGWEEDQLFGYYLSEDNGNLLRIFPGSERMRYLVPFQDPEQTTPLFRGGRVQEPGCHHCLCRRWRKVWLLARDASPLLRKRLAAPLPGRLAAGTLLGSVWHLCPGAR